MKGNAIYQRVIDKLDLVSEFGSANNEEAHKQLKKYTKLMIKLIQKEKFKSMEGVYVELAVQTPSAKLSTKISSEFINQFSIYINEMNLVNLGKLKKKFDFSNL